MSFLPEPDPLLLGFLTFRRFVFLPVLSGLALLRTAVGAGPSRLAALGALALALAGTLTAYAPAAGLDRGVLYASAAQTMALAGGLWAALVPAALMLVSAILPGVHWRWIDSVFAVMLIALLGLWWWTS